jgi:hypothetical protein
MLFLEQKERKVIYEKLKQIWAKSFWPLLALLCGVLIGVLTATNEIINDCKFAGSFRVDTQAFTCQRRI